MSAGLQIVGCEDLIRLGLKLGSLVRQVLILDHRVYSAAIHGHIGTPAQWEPVFRRHPQTWRAVLDRSGALLGYWQIAPLKQSQFEKARSGFLNPCDLKHEDYSGLDSPGAHNLYFVSVCIDPAHRNLPTQWALIELFFRVAEKLALDGILFDEVAAVAHSEQGRQICRSFGLQSGGRAFDGGESFSGQFPDVVSSFRAPLERRLPRLLELYGSPDQVELKDAGLCSLPSTAVPISRLETDDANLC